jgi:catechol 2,3-dioxygenase-like lactoylglutathione lyase family enzyme
MSAAVGGIFLASEDPDRLAAWYRALGLPIDENGMLVQDLPGDSFQAMGGLVFSIMRARAPLAPHPEDKVQEEPYGRQRTTLNLRVADLEAVTAGLRARGFEVAGPKDYGYGSFVWTKDPDGNLVEIWQAG